MTNCPNGHGPMNIEKLDKSIRFRGIDLDIQVECHVCPVCGLESGSVEQAAATQRAISGAYRKVVGLLTGEEMREGRKLLSLTQNELAERMGVGIASIKRWEGGLIQSKSMDHALRMALQGKHIGDNYTGNRTFSIPRVKLVLREFEFILHKKLLVKNDRMLYAAKYLWYADMLAFRELGRSITGATYALLPMGPQLNNYRDLVDSIQKADETEAESLTVEETRVVTRIAKTFPKKSMIYKAVHKETFVVNKVIGLIIPYTDSIELTHLR
ncbi:MAG: type II toxin-antitoxin system MqsA family antitoxin [Thermodesulfobacteriota bacterium]|nr:type II toxin-antitoxin system MqsA family antitoxin [Thermodesulfobacteriota bacterium]